MEAAKVRCVTMALEGDAADWMVTLHNNTPKLKHYDQFMMVPCRQLDNPRAECKGRTRMKTINQWWRSVAEYTQEFNELVCHMTGWPPEVLMKCYKVGLNEELYQCCISCGGGCPSRPPALVCVGRRGGN